MTRVLIVSREISPSYSELLTGALGGVLGEKPAVLALHGGTHSAKFAPKLEMRHPQVVHFSSLDCLEQKDLDAAAEAGAMTVVDATDVRRVCLRGRLYECDRTFCSNAHIYDRAKCFAFRLDAVDDGVHGARLFRKCLPDGRAEHNAFLKICRRDSAEEFEFRLEEAEDVAGLAKKRLDEARLLSRVDFFLCSNPVICQALKDFGIDEKRIYTDETFTPLEGSGPAKDEMLRDRVETLARAYENVLGHQHVAKWQTERENSILLMQDLIGRKQVWESRPSHIELATNNKCNLRCLMCSPESRPEEAALTEEETRAICEQVFPAASLITPSAGSEPLLGDFELIAELCNRYDVQMNVITNGVLLKPEKYELMRRNLGRLQISFDSHEKETYEEIRAGAKYETVVRNIREVCKLAAADNIEVMTSSVIMKMNYDKMAEYVDFVADLGVTSVALQKLLINFPELKGWDVSRSASEEEVEREIDRAIEAAKRREINLHVGLGKQRVFLFNKKRFKTFKLNYLAELVIARYPKFCYHTAIYAKIDPDGSVFPCCRAPKDLLMGNIKEESFESIWNGKKYQQLRKEFFTGKLRKCCRDCPLLELYSEGACVVS